MRKKETGYPRGTSLFLFKCILVFSALVFVMKECDGAVFKILHYTETTGYNHNTKGSSLNMFGRVADSIKAEYPGSSVVIVDDDDGDEFSSLTNLKTYNLVVFSNTSGNSGLNSGQRGNFETYIDEGGSYLGIHAASDTYRHGTANGNKTGTWDWYAETVAGASVQESPNHTSSNKNANMDHSGTDPVLNNIPNPWNKTEEYYYWENGYLNNSFTTYLMVESTGGNSYDSPRMMAHGKSLIGGGFTFYTALGHSNNNFSSSGNLFEQLIFNVVKKVFNLNTVFAATEIVVNVNEGSLCFEVIGEKEGKVYLSFADGERVVRDTMDLSVGCWEIPDGCRNGIVKVRVDNVERSVEVNRLSKMRVESGMLFLGCNFVGRYEVHSIDGREVYVGSVRNGERGAYVELEDGVNIYKGNGWGPVVIRK